jgi:transposase-like protein
MECSVLAKPTQSQKGRGYIVGKKERVNREYPPEFKIQVCKEYYKGNLSLHQLADKHDIYPQMIVRWRKMYADHPELKGLKKAQPVKGSRKELFQKAKPSRKLTVNKVASSKKPVEKKPRPRKVVAS